MSHTIMATLAVILSELIPFDNFRCSFVHLAPPPPFNSYANIVLIIDPYVDGWCLEFYLFLAV